MKRFLTIVCVMFVAVSLGFSMSAKEVGKSLKSHKGDGYKFIKETEKDKSWKVEYEYSDTAYNVFILIADDVVNADDKNVVMYADVMVTDDQPSEEMLLKILELNIEDSEWGFFSLYSGDSGWMIQYNIKFRLDALSDGSMYDAVQYIVEAASYYNGSLSGSGE
ncbi:MAG: hypothetical protein A2Y33_16565 [Spirochaetes bacterium GWF1_51_8]|nr:MAG: hypothetical protein A2Y33_16565 [Spirochaetes bacterium GWF1_51_8]